MDREKEKEVKVIEGIFVRLSSFADASVNIHKKETKLSFRYLFLKKTGRTGEVKLF